MNMTFEKILFLFVFFSFILVFIREIDERAVKNNLIKLKKQSINYSITDNEMFRKLEKTLTKKDKIEKIRKYNDIILQAGLKLTYGQLKIFSLALSLIFGILILVLSQKLMFALTVIPIYFIPFQAIVIVRNFKIEKKNYIMAIFLESVIRLYVKNENMLNALNSAIEDFKDRKGVDKDLKEMYAQLNNFHVSPEEAIESLANKTGNAYVRRFGNYYKLSKEIQTTQGKKDLLSSIYVEINDNFKYYNEMKRKIMSPVRDAYLVTGAIPLVFIFQWKMEEDWLDFISGTLLGQAIFISCIVLIFFALWFINAKIAKPIDE